MPKSSPLQSAAYQLEISTRTATRLYQDGLVGEVWLCLGQSNMDFTLAKTAKRSFAGAADWEKAVSAADHPQLRMFTAEWTLKEFPQREVPGEWAVCSPQTAGDFSAVADSQTLSRPPADAYCRLAHAMEKPRAAILFRPTRS